MNVAMEKTTVGPGMINSPMSRQRLLTSRLKALSAPSGTAANNLSPELSPGKDGGEPRAVRRRCLQNFVNHVVVKNINRKVLQWNQFGKKHCE